MLQIVTLCSTGDASLTSDNVCGLYCSYRIIKSSSQLQHYINVLLFSQLSDPKSMCHYRPQLSLLLPQSLGSLVTQGSLVLLRLPISLASLGSLVPAMHTTCLSVPISPDIRIHLYYHHLLSWRSRLRKNVMICFNFGKLSS